MTYQFPNYTLHKPSDLPVIEVDPSLDSHTAFSDNVVRTAGFTTDNILYRGWPMAGWFDRYQVADFGVPRYPMQLETAVLPVSDLPPSGIDTMQSNEDTVFVATLRHLPKLAITASGLVQVTLFERRVSREHAGRLPLKYFIIPDTVPIEFIVDAEHRIFNPHPVGYGVLFGLHVRSLDICRPEVSARERRKIAQHPGAVALVERPNPTLMGQIVRRWAPSRRPIRSRNNSYRSMVVSSKSSV